jgi:hypothetical protein
MKKYFVFVIFMVVFVSSVSHGQVPLDSDFSYQGELRFNNSLANGKFDFQFVVFDANENGSQIAQTINEDVDVKQGVFTTIINFGTLVFLGDKVWLEIRVREGNNTGGFQQLLPRQQITSSPYAIHAQYVGANAVSDIEILDGSITAVDLADNSVTASKIATNAVGVDEISANSVGTSEIINTEVQTRIVDSCPNGSNVQGVNVDGTVNCQIDSDTTNTYTAGIGLSVSANNVFSLITNGVTSIEIADGAVGLTELADNSVDTLAVIDANITREKIAPGAIGINQIDPNEVQVRVVGRCNPGEFLRGIGVDGSFICELLPVAFNRVLDTIVPGFGNGPTGDNTNVAVRTDDRPIVVYYDNLNLDLKLYDCADKTCSTGVIRTLDSNGDVGQYVDMTLRPDDRAVITYYDGTNGDLKLYDCADANCSSGVAHTVDASNNTGIYTSVTLRNDGRPYISYFNITFADLAFFNCANSTCDTGVATPLGSPGAIGLFTSVQIRPDGNANIAYYDETNDDLEFFNCGNESCNSNNAGRNLDNFGSVGVYTFMRNRSDHKPLITYSDRSNADLLLFDCNNEFCTSGTRRILDSMNNISDVNYMSMVIRSDDRAVISYWDTGSQDLKIYVCANKTCSLGVARTLVSAGNVGLFTSIDLTSDERPVISYWDAEQGQVKLYICPNPECE